MNIVNIIYVMFILNEFNKMFNFNMIGNESRFYGIY